MISIKRAWLLLVLNVTTTVLVPIMGLGSGQDTKGLLETWAMALVYTNVTGIPALIAGPSIVEALASRGWPLPAAVLAVSIAFTALGCFAAQTVLMWTGLAVPGNFWRQYLYTMGGAFLLSVVFGLGAFSYASMRDRLRHSEEKLHEREIAEARAEQLVAEARLRSLEARLHPHFLFNTLNSIGSLIRARSGDRALSMLLGLSELLRTTVDGTRHHTTTLGAEAAFVKRYIELQRARFSDRLEVTYDLSPESEACAVPSFLLQPVVENAFRHGLAKRTGPCHLELAASVEGRDLHVRVRDDGAGLPTDFNLTRHAGTGLRNTRQRLERLYDRAAQLTLEPADGGGTVVHIRLPAQAGAQEKRALG
jgi:sensor histidine kinase YesM